MKNGIYMYYDRVAESYIRPVLSIYPNDEAATRDFVGMLMSSEWPADKRMADYDLVRLASYDLVLNRVCEVVVDPSNSVLCSGVRVQAMKKELERRAKLGEIGDEPLDSDDLGTAALRLARSDEQSDLLRQHS